jgi:hypothetical protein
MRFAAAALAIVCSPALHAEGVELHVGAGGAEVRTDVKPDDVGLPVYPGAHRLKKKGESHSESVKLGIWTGEGGFHLAVVKYRSDDSAEKVRDFYRAELSRIGTVVECAATGEEGECDDHEEGTIELRVKSKGDRRIVAISPKEHGCKFVLLRIGT